MDVKSLEFDFLTVLGLRSWSHEMAIKKEKNPHAVALGQLGAKARLEKLTPARRIEIAKKAIHARWAKTKKKKRTPG